MNPNIARLMLFKSDTLVNPAFLAVAHETSPYLSIYRHKQNGLSKMSNPADLPDGDGLNVDFTNDGAYLAVNMTASPYVAIYKRNNSKFTRLADPAVLPPSGGHGIDFSSNGLYLALGCNATPYLAMYKRNGDTFTNLNAYFNVMPPDSVKAVRWSPDNVYFAVAHQGAPYVSVYKRTSSSGVDSFTRLADTLVLGVTPYDISWSNDGRYLIAAITRFPGFDIFKKFGDTFTRLTSPTSVPGITCGAVGFSPDSNYLAIGTLGSGIWVYKRSGDTFTLLNTVPTGSQQIQGVSWSADSLYLAAVYTGTPFIQWFRRDIDTFTLLNNPNIIPTGEARGLSFFPTGFDSTATLPPDIGAAILPTFSAGNTGVGTRYQQSYTAPEFMQTIQAQFNWQIYAYADYGYTFCNADVYRNGVAIYNGRVGGGPTLGGNGTWYRDYTGQRGTPQFGPFNFAINAGDTITATLYIGTRDGYTPNHSSLSCSMVRTS
jgi:WD40 repeat protein